MTEALDEYWPHIIPALSVVLSAIASAHAVMYKRESHSATAWVAVIWLSPFIGPALYVLIGINRIRRRAILRSGDTRWKHPGFRKPRASDVHEDALERAIDHVADFRREEGHLVEILENGDRAYPAMRAAIARATSRVHFCTYIFDRDRAGQEFHVALRDAAQRGVDVRVIVDDIGARYSFPSIVRPLRKAGVSVARFGPSRWPWHMRYANLRNHRKILVVDDTVAFAGGMNIREGNVLGWKTRHGTRDMHFRFEGPAVHQIDAVFCDDWELATKESLPRSPPGHSPRGPVRARCLPDGPDSPVDSIRWSILSGLACSKRRVRIVTPYFVPDAGLITALCTAALRGVRVEIVLPEPNNLRLVKWASQALLWQVLEKDCHVILTPSPFDHTKLMLVDEDWCLVGSANWDARSLRLNFELNVECQDAALAALLHGIVDRKVAEGRVVTLTEVDARSFPVRLRDGVARLFSPYL